MKFFLVLALAVAAVAAVPADYKTAEVVSQKLDNIGVDGYSYEYQTSDGKSASENGVLKNVGTDAEAMEVRGQFSYVGDDGVTYTVTYTAGVEGFVPSAAHLPVPVQS